LSNANQGEVKPDFVPAPAPERDQFTAKPTKPKWDECMSNQSDAQVKPDFVPPPPLIRIGESQEIKKPQK